MKRALACLGLLVALAGCQGLGTSGQNTGATPAPVSRTAPSAPSATSIELSRYYQSVQSRMLALGLMRQDGDRPDFNITAGQLATNFENIALFNEYSLRGGRFVAERAPSSLRRWAEPVVLQPVFGASVPEAQVARDTATLTQYAARLSRVTRHPVHVAASGPANYHVLFLDADEQRRAGPLLQQILPGIGSATIQSITQMPRSTFCGVYAFDDANRPFTYVAAIAIIKAEHPTLMRLSCIHEEIAQGLGLANDSRAARPSIFNDDDEFALLTRHDEILLSMLYDPRLRPGMTPQQARPLVARIAREKVGGSS
ncbi:MAG: hypothetical protein ACI9KS_001728 [Sulfitobacter sp.]|jgi:hypothetical protein